MVKAREYRDECKEKLKKLRKGNRADITYDKAMEQFLQHCDNTLKPSAVKRYEVSARAWHPRLTGRLLPDITKPVILEHLDHRAGQISGSGVNRDRALISSFFTFCVERDWAEYNPVLTIKKQRENEPRTRNFTTDEFKKIHAECGKLLADMAEFATLTGLRPSELVFLKHANIDIDNHQLTVDQITAKSKRSRIVPLPEKAINIYTSQIRHINSPYVFWHADGLPYKEAPRAFVRAALDASQKAAKKASGAKEREYAEKLKDSVLHDLRRTYTCWEFRKGVKLETLSKLLGHSSYAITEKHYWFLLQDDLHEAIRGVTNSSQPQGTLGVNLSNSTKGKARKH